MIWQITIAVGLAALICASLASPPASQPIVDAALDAQLAEIDRRVEKIADLTADFVQLKHTALLKKPLESRGSLWVKGAAMRWDTTSPSMTIMTVDQGELRLYSAQERLLEIYSMERGLGQIAASPLPRLAVVREHFTIEHCEWPNLDKSMRETHLAVKLMPREDSLRQHVQEVRVLLELAAGCATAVRIVDPDGDELEITFTNIRTNTGIPDDKVKFDPPPGTKVSRPLEAKRAARHESEVAP